jgi:hypothetical protein
MRVLPPNHMTSPHPANPAGGDIVYHPDVITSRVVVAGAVLLLAALALAWTTGLANVLRANDCRAWPTLLAFGKDTEASMVVHGSIACPISLQAPSLTVEELTMTQLPENGTVTARGRTGVTYRPSPNFKGKDFFAFAVRGRSAAQEGTSLVRVRVAVH